MSITVHLLYKGKNGNAQKFAQEMESSGIANLIREEKGNLRYDYFISMKDPETVLLVDSWENQEAIDLHHASPMMSQLAALREKYDLHMEAERMVEDSFSSHDQSFIRK